MAKADKAKKEDVMAEATVEAGEVITDQAIDETITKPVETDDKVKQVDDVTAKTTKAGKHSAKAQKEQAEDDAKKVRKQARAEAETEAKPKAKPHIKRYTKNYKQAREAIDRTKPYVLADAIELIKKVDKTKFDGSIELHVRLGIDPRQSDQAVRTNVVLPAGTGRTIRIAVLASDKIAEEAKKAGADMADAEHILDNIAKSKFDFDVLIATPDQMIKLGKHAKVLGPKGLMPSPKSGTVTADPATAIAQIKQGRVELKNDANAIIHTVIGKKSFTTDKLVENATASLDAITKAKPSAVKGTYIASVFVAGSMTPAVRVDHK